MYKDCWDCFLDIFQFYVTRIPLRQLLDIYTTYYRSGTEFAILKLAMIAHYEEQDIREHLVGLNK